MTGQDLKILLKIVGEIDPSAVSSVKAAGEQLKGLAASQKEVTQAEQEATKEAIQYQANAARAAQASRYTAEAVKIEAAQVTKANTASSCLKRSWTSWSRTRAIRLPSSLACVRRVKTPAPCAVL